MLLTHVKLWQVTNLHDKLLEAMGPELPSTKLLFPLTRLPAPIDMQDGQQARPSVAHSKSAEGVGTELLVCLIFPKQCAHIIVFYHLE